MAPHPDPPSQPASTTISCRVTPEEKGRIIEWARASGRDVSDFVRAAISDETHATAAALEAARREGDRAARADAAAEIAALQASLEQERQACVACQQQVGQMQQQLLFTSSDLLHAVRRSGDRSPGARTEVARLWACMTVYHRFQLLPAITTKALEWIEDLQTDLQRFPTLFLPKYYEVLENVLWLKQTLDPYAGLPLPQVRPATPEWAPVADSFNAAYELLSRSAKAAGCTPTQIPELHLEW